MSPASGTGVAGTDANLTLTATDANNNPLEGVTLYFGPQGGVTSDSYQPCITDANGQCSGSYTGSKFPGTDPVMAYADDNLNGQQDTGEATATGTWTWTYPTSTNGIVSGNGTVVSSDGVGSITFNFSGLSLFGLKTGSCQVHDPEAGVTINCTSVSVLAVNGNQVTMFGNATINGTATMYRIDATAGGAGVGSFTMTTSSGYTNLNNVLESGSVSV
jgi:hypothetical protein